MVQRITSYYVNRRFKASVIANFTKTTELGFEFVNIYDVATELYYSYLDDTSIQIRMIIKNQLTKIIKENAEDTEYGPKVASWFINPFIQDEKWSADEVQKKKEEKTNTVQADLKDVTGPQKIIDIAPEDIVGEQYFSVVPADKVDRAALEARTSKISQFNVNEQNDLCTDWFNACRNG